MNEILLIATLLIFAFGIVIISYDAITHKNKTQIYLEQDLLTYIQQTSLKTGLSVSAYVHQVLREKLNKQKIQVDDVAGIWQDRDITQAKIRTNAWK